MPPPKTAQQRIDATLVYIQANVSAAARAEVVAQLPAAGTAAYNAISAELSFGWYVFGNLNQRHALRALLLCHRVFMDDAVARTAEMQHVRATHSGTAANVLNTHIASWFTTAGSSAATVCAAATASRLAMPMWDNNRIVPRGLVRGVMPNYMFNCYNAVVFWAFQGGCISLRWIWNHWVPAGTIPQQEQALLPTPLQALPALDAAGEHPVPQAHVIVMTRPHNNLGHTVMSLGNGLCISQNNKQLLPAVANTEATAPLRAHALAAINACNQRRCHELSIRFLVQQYYPLVQTYTPFHHPPFWLHSLPARR